MKPLIGSLNLFRRQRFGYNACHKENSEVFIMKKLFFFFVGCSILFSCRKGDLSPKSYPSETEQISGTLHYDNFPDGWGLYYATAHENLIFKNEFASTDAQYQHFKKYVNVATRLYYVDKGDTSCLYGIGPVCGIRMVEVINLINE